MIYTDHTCSLKIKLGSVTLSTIANGFRKLLSTYAQLYNNKYGCSGSLFRPKTKSKCLTDIKVMPARPKDMPAHVINCFHYIHQNPLVAGLVTRLEDWEFSSFHEYAGLKKDGLCRRDLAALFCDYNPESFIAKSYEIVDKKSTYPADAETSVEQNPNHG